MQLRLARFQNQSMPIHVNTNFTIDTWSTWIAQTTNYPLRMHWVDTCKQLVNNNLAYYTGLHI